MDLYPFKLYIESRNELFEIIRRVRMFRGYVHVHEMFRGQERNEWHLQPNIARNKTVKEIQLIEQNLINDFHNRLIEQNLSEHIQKGFFKEQYHSDWLLIQQAQHYRLPTRLLDWTIDWKVALFFAVSNEYHDDVDGQFWINLVPDEYFISEGKDTSYLSENPYTYNKTAFLNSSGFLGDGYLSRIAMRRKTRQNGRFSIQPYSELQHPLDAQPYNQYLHKIIIPKEIKPEIREQLTKEDITNASLYIQEDEAINIIIKDLKEKYSL
jgi:hypothetical protein